MAFHEDITNAMQRGAINKRTPHLCWALVVITGPTVVPGTSFFWDLCHVPAIRLLGHGAELLRFSSSPVILFRLRNKIFLSLRAGALFCRGSRARVTGPRKRRAKPRADWDVEGTRVPAAITK